MSYMQRVSSVCRQNVQWQQRCFSSSTLCLQKQQQYGEGFAPPKGSRDTEKQVHRRRRIATSIPSHLGNAAKQQPLESSSPKKQYREELRSARHQYAQELLKLQGQRDAAAATKRMQNEEWLREMKQQLEQAKNEQSQLEKEVVATMLSNTAISVDTKDELLDRAKQREQHRLEHEQSIRSARLRQLVKMYHDTENFVTLDNLDQRVDMLLAHKGSIPMYTLAELMVTPAAEADEIKNRKELLNEVMGL